MFALCWCCEAGADAHSNLPMCGLLASSWLSRAGAVAVVTWAASSNRLGARVSPAGQGRQPLTAHTAAGLRTMKTPMYLYSVNRNEVAPSLMAA